MGNEQSVAKTIASVKKRNDTSLVFRGEVIEPKWIPQDIINLKLEIIKWIDSPLITIPPIVLQISSIKQLDLSSNQLVSITGIGALINLSDLNVSENKLDYLPDDFVDLKNLKFLNLSNNSLTLRSLPTQMLEWKTLSFLDISHNKFVKLSQALADLLFAAESITIHDNPWENVELQKLSSESTEEHSKALLRDLIGRASHAAQPVEKIIIKGKHQRGGSSSLQKNKSVDSLNESSTPQEPLNQIPKRTAPPIPIESDPSATPTRQQSRLSEALTVEPVKPHVPSPAAAQHMASLSSNVASQAGSPTGSTAHSPSHSSTPQTKPVNAAVQNVPPPVVKSPVAKATESAAAGPERTTAYLKPASRVAGPKGRKLPTAAFIEKAANEGGDVVVLTQDGKSELKVVGATVSTADGPPPVIPSKSTKPERRSSTPTLLKTDEPIKTTPINNNSNEQSEKEKKEPIVVEKKKVVGGVSMFGAFGGHLKGPSFAGNNNSSTEPSKYAEKETANNLPAESVRNEVAKAQEPDVNTEEPPATSVNAPPKPKKIFGGISMFGNAQQPNLMAELKKQESVIDSASNTLTSKRNEPADASSTSKKVDAAPNPQEKLISIPPPPAPKKLDSIVSQSSFRTQNDLKREETNNSISNSPSVSITSKPVDLALPKKVDTPPPSKPENNPTAVPAPPPVSKKPDQVVTQPSITNTTEPQTSPKKGMFGFFNTTASNNVTPAPAPVPTTPLAAPVTAPVVPQKPDSEPPQQLKKPPPGGVSMFGGGIPTANLKKDDSEGTVQTPQQLRKIPVGAVSILGGVGIKSDVSDISSDPNATNSPQTTRKVPVGGISMFGAPLTVSKPSSPVKDTPLSPAQSNSQTEGDSDTVLSPTELRERLKQQISSNFLDSNNPKPASPPKIGPKPLDKVADTKIPQVPPKPEQSNIPAWKLELMKRQQQ